MLSQSVTDWLLTLFEIVSFSALVILTLAVILGFKHFRLRKKPVRLFLFYLLLVLCVEIFAKVIVYGKVPINNLFLMYPYLFIEFVLLSFTYKNLLESVSSKSYAWTNYVTITIAAGIIGYSIYMLRVTGNTADQFQLYPKLVIHGMILFYSFRFVLASFRKTRSEQDLIVQFIPINNGVFLYFTGSFVVFPMLNYLINSSLEFSIIFFLANSLLTLTFYAFCLFALWKSYPKIAS